MTSAPRALMSADPPAAPPPVAPLTLERIEELHALLQTAPWRWTDRELNGGWIEDASDDIVCLAPEPDAVDSLAKWPAHAQLIAALPALLAAASSGAEARAKLNAEEKLRHRFFERAVAYRNIAVMYDAPVDAIDDDDWRGVYEEWDEEVRQVEQRAAAADARVALLTEAEWDALAKGAACIVPKVATMEMQKAAVLGFSVGAYTEFTPADAYAAMLAASPYRAALQEPANV